MKRFIFILLLISGIYAQITIPTYASSTDGFRLLGPGNDSLGLDPTYWQRYYANIDDLKDAIITVNFQNTLYKWGTDEINATVMIEGEDAALLDNTELWTTDADDDNFVKLGGFEFRVRTNDSLLVWDTSLNRYKKASVFEVMNGDSKVPGYAADLPALCKYDGDLVAAVAAMGSSDTTLVIDTEPDSLTDDLVFPVTLNVVWNAGYPLSTSDDDTLTINGSLTAGMFQVFDSTLTVERGSDAPINISHPVWFGSTGDGATNDTWAMQSAMDF